MKRFLGMAILMAFLMQGCVYYGPPRGYRPYTYGYRPYYGAPQYGYQPYGYYNGWGRGRGRGGRW